MMNHADVLDLADLYALDALPPDVALDVEAHLAECAECRAAVESAWEVAKLLRQAVPVVDPPPGLRARLLEIARADVPAPVPVQSARGNEPVNEPVREPREPRGDWVPPRWLSLAALVPLLLGLFVTNSGQALLGAVLVRRLLGPRIDFDNLRKIATEEPKEEGLSWRGIRRAVRDGRISRCTYACGR